MDFKPGQRIDPQFVSAWVEPDGTFHFVPYSSHVLVALQFAEGARPDDVLLMQGWCKLSVTVVESGGPFTQAQVTALWEALMQAPLAIRAIIMSKFQKMIDYEGVK